MTVYIHVNMKKQPFSCVYLTCVFVCVQSTASRVAAQESQIKSPLEKHHADAVVNFLLRIACQVKLTHDPAAKFYVVFKTRAAVFYRNRPDEKRAASFLNGFKNIPGKACVKRVHNNDAFVSVGN